MMSDELWEAFFLACADILGPGHACAPSSQSWCAWTTFTRLAEDAGYWTGGLPGAGDIGDAYVKDGGVWGQPFSYADLAHIIVPRTFGWMTDGSEPFRSGRRHQDIRTLSLRLNEGGIGHRMTDRVLEIKLY
jgi:hypothetical protein